MAFSKIVARPMASSNKKQAVEDEYEYYKMYVNESTKATETSATLQYLKLKHCKLKNVGNIVKTNSIIRKQET